MGFEVGEKQLRWNDEGSQVEWGIEAEGRTLRDYLEGTRRAPAIVWEPIEGLLCNILVEMAVRFQPPLYRAAV